MRILTILLLVFSSCGTIYRTAPDAYLKDSTLFHKYQVESSSNNRSAYRVINRNIEFEYTSIEQDSIAEVMMLLTTGFNEGTIQDEVILVTNNDEVFHLPILQPISREYIDSHNYSTSIPVTSTNLVTTPASTDVVIGSDGKVTHVNKPAVTQTVTETNYERSQHSKSKSQLFNQGKLMLDKNQIEKIEVSGIKYFEIQLETAVLVITPSYIQNTELKKYL